MIPTTPSFVEVVAKAIGRNRMWQHADAEVRKYHGKGIENTEILEDTFEKAFLDVWDGQTSNDEHQRQVFRADAIAAISAINLKLLTT